MILIETDSRKSAAVINNSPNICSLETAVGEGGEENGMATGRMIPCRARRLVTLDSWYSL